MKKIRALIVSFLAALLMMPALVEADLTTLSDAELSAQSGQALFMMDKITGDCTVNGNGIGCSAGSAAKGQTGITFYKMGLDAVLDLNANIGKLQLGCGGVKGAGCDIDIDNLSLSGNPASNAACASGRPNCDAQLNRPFVQFAIKNDSNPATRQIVGWRFSAEKATGLLTAGYQDPSTSESGTDTKNGINSLSGYMSLSPTSGTAKTAPRIMAYTDKTNAGITYPGLGSSGVTNQATLDTYCGGSLGVAGGCGVGTAAQVKGRVYTNTLLGTGSGALFTSSYDLVLNSANVVLTTSQITVYGSRMSSVALTASGNIAPLGFSGTMQANAQVGAFTLGLGETVSGTITGLTATANITESLSYIHSIPVNNPFSLSMQNQNLLWPGASAQAMTGWWMAFEDPINIGNISPQAQVDLTNAILMQALTGGSAGNGWATDNTEKGTANSGTTCTNLNINCSMCQVASINCALYRGCSYVNTADCFQGRTPNGNNLDGVADMGVHGVGCFDTNACLSGSLAIGTIPIPANLSVPLTDLKLSAQGVTPNCWGSSKFC